MSQNPESPREAGENEAPYATRTIALVGLMGAGKSTVGRRLADALSRRFHDSDDEIERAAGMTIADIFTLHGEEEFRRGEKRVLARLLEGPPHVLATGGGAYMDPETRQMLREKAVTVWLNADLRTLWRRVSRRGHRPLLKTANPREVLANLFEQRAPVYSEADLIVESRDGPHTNVVRDIIAALEAWRPE